MLFEAALAAFRVPRSTSCQRAAPVARRMSANAARMDPKVSIMASAPSMSAAREGGGARSTKDSSGASRLGPAGREFGDALAWPAVVAAVVGEQALGALVVAEDVDDARRGGDGAVPKRRLDPGLEFLGRVELLERPGCRSAAVAIGRAGVGVGIPRQPGGHDEN